ncbi:MAG: LacI family DNA-binding transcriptional regulator [Armatimonadota bacterium]|nr:LacI family transcriptional regulator [bacterium]MDW8321900.1 LacI family DNA-binding transcriptional regulator [Armatimonadota bacterium]
MNLKRMKRVDITTIARELGVSTTTVHRALNNNGRVSETTRQRVLETAQRLGYRPNQIARGLRSRRTCTLGVIVTGISSTFYAHILDGIESAAREAGYSILLGCSHDDPEKERQQIELLLEKQVDGLILAPAIPSVSASYYSRLVREGVHLVFVGRHVPGVTADSVETNNVLGGYLVGQHLYHLGRRHIVIVTTVLPKRQYSYVRDRISGCENALRDLGGTLPVVVGEDIPDRLPLPLFAYTAIRRYLQEGGIVDGVFALNDDLAYGVINALYDAGQQVPDDVSVVGFNDESMSAYFRPSLTTVRSAPREVGIEAVRLLLAHVEESDTPTGTKHVLLEPTLVVRDSCGAKRLNQTPLPHLHSAKEELTP